MSESDSIRMPKPNVKVSNNGETAEDNQKGKQEARKEACEKILSNSFAISTNANEVSSTGSSEAKAPTNPDCDTRLWIGNLDPRLREFHLLKMVQRYGTIDNFDFLFHRSGPNAGLPRGYAFVTFQDKEAADKCLKKLDGVKVMDKHVAVRWAHQAIATFIDEETKLKSKLPALSMKKEEPTPTPQVTKEKAITAIEAKLRAMERDREHGDGAGSSGNFFYQYNKDQSSGGAMKSKTFHQRRPYDRSRNSQQRRPYQRR